MWLYIAKCVFFFSQLWLCFWSFHLYISHCGFACFSVTLYLELWLYILCIYARFEWPIAKLKNYIRCLVLGEQSKEKMLENAADECTLSIRATWLSFCLCVCVFTKTIVTRPHRKLLTVWTAFGAWNRLGRSARVKKTNWMKPLLVLISFERVSFLLLHKSKPVLRLDSGQVNMPRLTLILSAFPHHL